MFDKELVNLGQNDLLFIGNLKNRYNESTRNDVINKINLQASQYHYYVKLIDQVVYDSKYTLRAIAVNNALAISRNKTLLDKFVTDSNLITTTVAKNIIFEKVSKFTTIFGVIALLALVFSALLLHISFHSILFVLLATIITVTVLLTIYLYIINSNKMAKTLETINNNITSYTRKIDSL